MTAAELHSIAMAADRAPYLTVVSLSPTGWRIIAMRYVGAHRYESRRLVGFDTAEKARCAVIEAEIAHANRELAVAA